MAASSREKFYIVLIIALIAISGFLFFNNFQLKKESKTSYEQFEFVDSLKNDLEIEFDEAILDLERYKGENEELNDLIEEKQEDIKKQKKKIDNLLAEGRRDKSKITEANALIKQLQINRTYFINQVDSLTTISQTLFVEKKNLQVELIEEKEIKTKLVEDKKVLTEEKQKLEATVNLGSILKASAVNGIGVNSKNSGKEKETLRAKKADKLKICFELNANRIATKGKKSIYMQLTQPNGIIATSSNYKSGSFEDAKFKAKVNYSRSFLVDYTNASKVVCLFWEQEADFVPGKYDIDLYQAGYPIGNGQFELK